MKWKHVLPLLGLKPKPKTYGYEIVEFTLPSDGRIAYAQWLHPHETRKTIRQSHVNALRAYLGDGDVAIDIGAHTGDSTLPLALAAGPTGHVLAVEPNQYVLEVLRKNAELNPQKTSIEVLNVAATEEDGPIEFAYSDPGFCNGGRHEGISVWVHGHAFAQTVPGRNLGLYLERERPELADRIRFIKVDAEGYDATILKSLRPVIVASRPVIKVEVYRHLGNDSRLRLWRLLDDMRYDVFRVTDDDEGLSDRITAGNLSNWPHFDVLCIPQCPVPKAAGPQPSRESAAI